MSDILLVPLLGFGWGNLDADFALARSIADVGFGILSGKVTGSSFGTIMGLAFSVALAGGGFVGGGFEGGFGFGGALGIAITIYNFSKRQLPYCFTKEDLLTTRTLA